MADAPSVEVRLAAHLADPSWRPGDLAVEGLDVEALLALVRRNKVSLLSGFEVVEELRSLPLAGIPEIEAARVAEERLRTILRHPVR